jgi:hypothetical protein
VPAASHAVRYIALSPSILTKSFFVANSLSLSDAVTFRYSFSVNLLDVSFTTANAIGSSVLRISSIFSRIFFSRLSISL